MTADAQLERRRSAARSARSCGARSSTASRSSTRAGWCATRSCSSSRSAASSPRSFRQRPRDASAQENVFAGLVAVVALVHGAVRELRRGDGRGARQGAGRHAPQDARGDRRAPPDAPDGSRRGRRRASELRLGDVVVVDGRRGDPRRRRRRSRASRSVDESAITGESAPGHPRVRRRPLAPSPAARACSPTRSSCAITAEPGRDVPRPDDRARRGRRAAEDAERDRAQHPARRAHDHLPARGRDAPAVRDLLAAREQSDRSCSSRCSSA